VNEISVHVAGGLGGVPPPVFPPPHWQQFCLAVPCPTSQQSPQESHLDSELYQLQLSPYESVNEISVHVAGGLGGVGVGAGGVGVVPLDH